MDVKKFIRYSKKILWLTPFVPIALLFRFVSIFHKIRITPLFCARIGHFAMDTELHLCMKEKSDLNFTELFCFTTKEVCNDQLAKMWRRVIPLYYGLRGVFWANHYLNKLFHPMTASRDFPSHLSPAGESVLADSDFNNQPVRLYFTKKEKHRGEHFLRLFLQDPEKGFVCIHSRSPIYLENTFPSSDFHYHNYRDSDIHTFQEAAEYLARQGYTVFRMGASKEKNFIIENKYVIDYANQHRNSFLDIFLSANCQFYIGDASGLSAIPSVFKIPAGVTNAIPINCFSYILLKNVLYIPKLYWDEKKGRLLTFKEMLSEPHLSLMSSKDFQNAQVTVVNNTLDELADFSKEMHLKNIGVWKEDNEDQNRQKKLLEYLKQTKYCSEDRFIARMGSYFLRKYEHLL